MMLLTKAIRQSLPPLYSQKGKGLEAVARVKFFTPDSSFTWYASEASEDEGDLRFFGLVTSDMCPEGELGYFMLSELRSATGRFGLHIERDKWWTPRPLRECRGS